MSLRGKTQKAKKFGTPSTPSPTAQKPSPTSPRATGGTPSAPPTAQPRTPSPKSYGITQTQAGQVAQTQFGKFTSNLAKTIIHGAFTAATKQEKALIEINAALRGKDITQLSVGQQKHVISLQEERKELEIEIQSTIEKAKDADLSASANQIINAINENKVFTPDWFQNNITWVQTGQTTNKEFLDAYNNLANKGIIYSTPTEPIIELPELLPEVEAQIEPIPIITPTVDESINTNMVTQQVINFNIVNGRAVGSIKFLATNNFNPHYYNKEIINLVQFKTPNGVTLLVKENRLRFTETERDEIISYDENIQENTRITVESFVWEWIDKPAGAFSNMYSVKISEKEPPKPVMTGFMGAGVAGAIAGLILIGFIVDSKVNK
jgi:hypothetical protein